MSTAGAGAVWMSGAVDNDLGILDIAQVVAVPVGFAREPLGEGVTVGPQEYLFGFVALLTVDEGACEGDVPFEPALVKEQGGAAVLIGRGAGRPAGPFALTGGAVVRHGDVRGDKVKPSPRLYLFLKVDGYIGGCSLLRRLYGGLKNRAAFSHLAYVVLCV